MASVYLQARNAVSNVDLGSLYPQYMSDYNEVLGDASDESVDSGMTFSPTSDTSKATAVNLTDNYASTVFSAVNYAKLVTIDGSSRSSAINLIGNSLKNKLIGGSAADTLQGGEGNDSLTGGDGADTFVSSLGKNVITDYTPSQGDVILLNNVTPTKVKVSKNNVVITNSDKSTFTITNGKGVKLNAIDLNGNTFNQLSQAFGDTELVVSSQESVISGGVINATLNTSIKTIDASAATVTGASGLTITGNAKANSIVGSDYVDNTIIAGAGKDTLTGGGSHIIEVSETAGNGEVHTYPSTVHVHNTFVLAEGQGANVITNYNPDYDFIKLSSGSVYSYKTSKDDVIFTIALNGKKKTTLTVKNGKNKLITFLNADGSINTANTMIYRNTTDYIVTTQETVSTALVNVVDKLGDKVKLIDASTTEYKRTDGVYIEGNAKANSIIGSTFSDTITGGLGKDTFTGGHSTVEGDTPYYDTYLFYSGQGNKVITDYLGTSDTGKSDVIKLADPNTTISTSALNTKKGAADVVLTTTNAKGKSKATITLKNAQDSLVTIVKTLDTLGNSDSEETIAPQKYGNKSLTVGTDAYPIEYKTAAGDVTLRVVDTSYNAKVVTLDGSEAGGNLYLIGNSAKNVITGSASTVAGDTGNTLVGGKGNDTLVGSAGVVDYFRYDTLSGTDVVVSLEAAVDYICMDGTDVHITASTLVTKKDASNVQLTIGKDKVEFRVFSDAMAGTNVKGAAAPSPMWRRFKSTVAWLLAAIDLRQIPAIVDKIQEVARLWTKFKKF